MNKAENQTTERERPAPQADERAMADTIIQPAGPDAARPVLKAKPVGSRLEGDSAHPSVRAGTLYSPEGAARPAGIQSDGEDNLKAKAMLRTIVMPPPDEHDPRYLYATHRPPPSDDSADKEEVAVRTGATPQTRSSAGFLWGIALVILLLMGTVFVGLSMKIRGLERRISRLETGTPAAVADAGNLR